jgi:hypothetical protein
MRAVILLLSLAIAGCSTPYQPIGFGGGVEAQQMSADTFRIRAKGNGRTASSTIMDYLLLKSAETAKAAGGTHFVILTAQNTTTTSLEYSSAQSAHLVGGMVLGSGVGSVDTVVRPGGDLYVRVLTVPKGQAPPANAIAADEVIKFIGTRVKQTNNGTGAGLASIAAAVF